MLQNEGHKELTLVRDFIHRCNLLSKQLKLYGPSSRQTDLAISQAQTSLTSYFSYHDTLHLTIGRNGFIFDDDFVEKRNAAFADFSYHLFQHGISSITIQKDVTEDDIVIFAALTTRSPAKSWEEGGITACLEKHDVKNIFIIEMTEDNLNFSEGITGKAYEQLLQEKSSLWDRFAFAVIRTDQDDSDCLEEILPGQIAEIANMGLVGMSSEDQQNFNAELAKLICSTQTEEVSRLRGRSLAKLTALMNQLSTDVRARLFQHIFTLDIKPTFAEEFFSGLSDEVVVELLEQTTDTDSYAPPVIMNVLGKMANKTKSSMADLGKTHQKIIEKKRDIAKLFHKDDFEKYVPEKYRDALLNIIHNDTVSIEAMQEVLDLKLSLDETQQETHTAEVIIKILNESADGKYNKVLGDHLTRIVYQKLEAGAYREMNELCHAVVNRESSEVDFANFWKLLKSTEVSQIIIRDARFKDREVQSEIGQLAVTIGTSLVVPFIEVIGEEENRANRLFFMNVVGRLDKQAVIDAATQRLEDSRWYFVRNLIKVLRNTQDEGVVLYLYPLTTHPNHKVRTEAIRTCLFYGCEKTTEQLLQMLDNKNPDTVDKAVSWSNMVNNSKVTARLIQLLKRSPVFAYHLKQKLAIAKILVESAPAEIVLPAFFDVLTTKNTLHPKKHLELQKELVKILERYDSETFFPALRNYASSTSIDMEKSLIRLKKKMESTP